MAVGTKVIFQDNVRLQNQGPLGEKWQVNTWVPFVLVFPAKRQNALAFHFAKSEQHFRNLVCTALTEGKGTLARKSQFPNPRSRGPSAPPSSLCPHVRPHRPHVWPRSAPPGEAAQAPHSPQDLGHNWASSGDASRLCISYMFLFNPDLLLDHLKWTLPSPDHLHR